MKNVRLKGITIDFIILTILCFLLMVGIYIVYDVFPNLPRFIAILLFLIMIPISWGTIIFSIKGKNTIGQKFASKNSTK